MDPLSVTASIIAVVGAASSVGRSLEKLSILRGAPAGILALNNEISDLRLILHEIDTVLQNNRGSIRPSLNISLMASLYQAKDKLLELESVIEYQVMTTNSDGSEIRINRFAWTRNQGRIHRIQESLRLIRLNLMVVLGVLSSSTSLRIEVKLQNVQLVMEDIRTHQQSSNKEDAYVSTSQNQATTDGVLSQIMESHLEREQILTRIQSQLAQIISNPTESLGTAETNPLVSYFDNRTIPDNMGTFHALRLSATCRNIYDTGCVCICHRRRHFQSPSLFTKILGSMFLGYSGLPVVSPRCDRLECTHGSNFAMSFDYIFPTWFIARKLHVELRYRQNLGPEQLLRVSRIVHPYSAIMRTVYEGDAEGTKLLLQNGGGSLFDVSSNSYMTPLLWAIQKPHLELCRVLLYAGADPYEKDIDQGTYAIAWNIILTNRCDTGIIAELQTIFNDTSYLEEYQFSFLHKVVLDLNPLVLLTVVSDMSISEINQGDVNGKTALSWAAERGDSDAVQLLLQHGADPNKLSHSKKSALYFAARSRSYVCVDALLNANADIKPYLSPLYQAVLFSGVEICELLLSKGARIDVTSRNGSTVLEAALAKSSSQMAEYLINQNSNIHYVDQFSTTALHYAIYYNHPKILSLLLHRAISHRTKSSVAGTALHCAGRRGNLEVIQVLTKAKLQNIDIEDKWEGQTALELAEQRQGMSAEWRPAFRRLLDSVNATETDTEAPNTPEEANGGFFDASEAATEVAKTSISRHGEGNNQGPGQGMP